MKRRTLDERIADAQEIGRQRWSRMVQREAERYGRELAAADREAKKRRAKLHVVREPKGGTR